MSSPPRIASRADGFSLVELLVALTIALVVAASAFGLLLPSQALASSRAEAADMQQRLRVAADTLAARVLDAGAGSFGATDGPLSNGFPPVLPYRGGGSSPDPPGTFKGDTITVFAVPRGGVAPVGTTYWLKSDNASGTYQLMVNDTTSSADVPAVDHIVALSFDYSGDPMPPTMRKPLTDPIGPWTTYGPKPATVAVPPFAPRENCIFVDVDPMSPVPQPRLATLDAPESLVPLPAALLTDGPWCPSDAAQDRWDADLLRVRSIAVVVRVQAAIAALRGPASALFAHGGSSRGGHQWVPDLEARFQISPRNLNRGR